MSSSLNVERRLRLLIADNVAAAVAGGFEEVSGLWTDGRNVGERATSLLEKKVEDWPRGFFEIIPRICYMKDAEKEATS